MGCQNAKAAQPVAKQQEPVPTQEAPKAEESKTAETQPVLDKPKEDKSAHKLSPGDPVTVARDGGIEGTVVKCTTTDVLVKSGGKDQWHDIEDVQQWNTPPPLDREVVVGSAVTTTEGLSGTVIRRTTTEVCLRTEGGEEKWCGIEDIVVVRLTIVRAADLCNADLPDKSAPYVFCQIEGRPTTVQTPTVVDSLDPIWNYEASLLGFQKGDLLKFKIWDSDSIKRDDFLGAATLSSDNFLESCFYGQLPLTNKEGQPTAGTLTVKVSVQPTPVEAPGPREEQMVAVEPQKIEPEVSAVKRKPTHGWCC